MGPERKPGQRRACAQGSGAPPRGGVYHSRNPRASPLWRCAQRVAFSARWKSARSSISSRAATRTCTCSLRHFAPTKIPYSRDFFNRIGRYQPFTNALEATWSESHQSELLPMSPSASSRNLCLWILVALAPGVTGNASIGNTRCGTLYFASRAAA